MLSICTLFLLIDILDNDFLNKSWLVNSSENTGLKVSLLTFLREFSSNLGQKKQFVYEFII